MSLFFTALVASLIIGFLFVQIQKLNQVKKQNSTSIEEQQKQLEVLNADLLKTQDRIKELQGILRVSREKEEEYGARVKYLQQFEGIKNLVLLEKEIERLQQKEKKYRDKISEHIDLANLQAEKIMSAAQERVDKLKVKEKEYRDKISEHIDSANLQAEKIMSAAQERVDKLKVKEKEYRDRINEHVTSANLRAQKIVAEAHRHAEEIAGDAINVAKDFRHYEQAVKAMKNIIEGYGNKYIIPGESLLDELAELYGHTEAGRELKRSREYVKQLIKNGMAGVCDYVEEFRKEIAVTFVVDAFNGKVDSILSRSKQDNYGTLRQEILDAFTIVNLNGRAFRNARITEEYMNARLDELKWACASQEVRIKHQEEQRKIREMMREEEKARREYERAIKEAKKEEEMLQRALEITKRQIAEATEEQKEKYEAKLLELQDQLKAAEEKNQRALSMAQQTKVGHVYIISNIGSFGEGVYKIGMTRRLEPMDRVKELGDASVPFDFDVHALIYSDDAPSLETSLHKYFILDRVNKVNHRREFFRAKIEDIKQQVTFLGLKAEWTMAAEARQYYETKSIEDTIAKGTEEKEAWIKSQYKLDEQELEAILSGRDSEEDDLES